MRAVAALCVSGAVLAACGDGLPAAPDAATDATSASPVRLTVAGNIPGLPVFFQAADGAVEVVTHTNADGVANAFVSPGGSVTLVAINNDLYTWGGVQPGDELELGHTPDVGDPSTGVLVHLEVPADAAATSYLLNTTCTVPQEVTGAQDIELPVYLPGCRGLADALVLTNKVDPTDSFQVVHAAARLGIDFDAPEVSLEIPGPLLDPRPSLITFANAPPGVRILNVHQLVYGEHGALFDTGAKHIAQVDLALQSTTTLSLPLPAGTRLATDVGELRDDGGSALRLISWVPTTTSTIIDLSGAPPALASIIWDPTHLTVSWSQSGVPARPQLGLAELGFADGRAWHIAAPIGSLPQLALPPLPDPDLLPQSAAVVQAHLLTIEATGDVSALRPTLFDTVTSKRWPIDGAIGRIAYQELDQSFAR